jgi:hypothetical protein
VILRHGGEATASRQAFAALPEPGKDALLAFLDSLVLFPPDDTASNLDPGNPNAPDFPQHWHGSIRLPVLFNDPTEPEVAGCKAKVARISFVPAAERSEPLLRWRLRQCLSVLRRCSSACSWAAACASWACACATSSASVRLASARSASSLAFFAASFVEVLGADRGVGEDGHDLRLHLEDAARDVEGLLFSHRAAAPAPGRA